MKVNFAAQFSVEPMLIFRTLKNFGGVLQKFSIDNFIHRELIRGQLVKRLKNPIIKACANLTISLLICIMSSQLLVRLCAIFHKWAVSTAGSAPGWQSGGRGFDPRTVHRNTSLASDVF